MRIAMVITFVELITVDHHFLIPMIVAQEVTILNVFYERGLQKENLPYFLGLGVVQTQSSLRLDLRVF